MAKCLLALLVFLGACADRDVMPPYAREAANAVGAALEAGDGQAACARMLSLHEALERWAAEEEQGIQIPGVTGRRAEALRLEAAKIAGWLGECAAGKVDAVRARQLFGAFEATAVNLKVLGTSSGWNRTVMLVLGVGGGALLLFLAWFAVVFWRRRRREEQQQWPE